MKRRYCLKDAVTRDRGKSVADLIESNFKEDIITVLEAYLKSDKSKYILAITVDVEEPE